MRRHEKSGLGSAYRAGFRWGLDSGFDVCVEMDADLSARARGAARPGGAAGRGARPGHRVAVRAGRLHPRLDLAPAPALPGRQHLCVDSCSGLGVADSTAGFRAYSASVLERIDLDRIRAEGYGFQIEMTYQAKRAGASVVEIPIRFVDRVDGESKMSMFIVVEALGLVTWWGVRRLVESLRRQPQPVRT